MTDTVCAVCPTCQAAITFEDVIAARGVAAIGMLIEPEPLTRLYFFNHAVPGCGTTFTLPIDRFETVLDEPVPGESRLGSETCEGRCVRVDDLGACSQPCENAPYRRFLMRLVAQSRPPRGNKKPAGRPALAASA